MNITDLLFGGAGAAPFMSAMSSGRGVSPFAGRPSMPGSPGGGMPGGMGDMGGPGGMDWATLMQMMSRMGGMGGMGGPMGMSGMGGSLGNVGAGANVNMGAAQSPILQAMQAALSRMRGGGAQQPMSPVNPMMRYR